MKSILKIVGIMLLILGIIVIVISNEGIEMSQPNEVRVGIMVNGEFQETDRGLIGGNSKMESEMGAAQGIGYLGCVIGAVMFLGSFMIKEKEPQY